MSADNLDEEFGVLRNATNAQPWEEGAKPASLCALDSQVGELMSMFLKSAKSKPIHQLARSVTFIWGMESDGTIRLAAEEVAQINGKSVEKGYTTR